MQYKNSKYYTEINFITLGDKGLTSEMIKNISNFVDKEYSKEMQIRIKKMHDKIDDTYINYISEEYGEYVDFDKLMTDIENKVKELENKLHAIKVNCKEYAVAYNFQVKTSGDNAGTFSLYTYDRASSDEEIEYIMNKIKVICNGVELQFEINKFE